MSSENNLDFTDGSSEGGYNITAAETLIAEQENMPADERDVSEIKDMITHLQSLQNEGHDSDNIRVALTKLIHLRDESIG